MDKWEQLAADVAKRLKEEGEELTALIDAAKNDALIDELGKITSAIGRLDGRLTVIEARLPDPEEDL